MTQITVHMRDNLPSSYNGKLGMRASSLACQAEGCLVEASVFVITSYTFRLTLTSGDPPSLSVVKRRFAHVSGACHVWHHQLAVREKIRRKANTDIDALKKSKGKGRVRIEY